VSGASIAVRLRPAAGRFGRRLLLALLAAAALTAAYLFWFRDLPVFAVDEVRVEGIPAGSPGAADLEAALVDSARGMTTLHVRTGDLQATANRFPLVESVSAEADFPSGLTITVEDRTPAALIGDGEDAVAVAEDGTLMPGLATDALDLPLLPLDRVPDGERLGGPMLDQALVLGAAPEALRPALAGVERSGERVVVNLAAGIELRFGAPVRVEEKWRAAAAVLADPTLTSVGYVDLSAPNRPAVGGVGAALPPAP
jgi:cell division septal protein FtsQ